MAYPAALAVALGLLVWQLGARATADVTLLRGAGTPFTTDASGHIVNQIRVKIANRSSRDDRYHLSLEQAPEAQFVAPINPLPVAAGSVGQTSVFVVLPPSAIVQGNRDVRLRVTGQRGYHGSLPYELIGPEPLDRVGARR